MPSTTADSDRVDAPATLVRTMDGQITAWSRAMELRYGFAREEALGRVAPELLRTTFCRPLHEIHSELVKNNTWSGVLIHHCADGSAMMVTSDWRLQPGVDGREAIITELHSDIMPGGTITGHQLADVMAAIAHQLSEPLTAIGIYVAASRRELERAWLDRMNQREAFSRISGQLARTTEVVGLLRNLAEFSRGVARCHQE